MRFLVDECCPRGVAEALRQVGHDVSYVPENDSGITDNTLVALAEAERRIVVTQDYDFGELAVRRGEPNSGVLLIACQSISAVERAERVVRVVDAEGEALVGRLTIIERKRLRYRSVREAGEIRN